MTEQSARYCGIIGLCAGVLGALFMYPFSLLLGVIGVGLAVLTGVYGQRVFGIAGSLLWGLSSLWSPFGTTLVGAAIVGGDPPQAYSGGLVVFWVVALAGAALSAWAPLQTIQPKIAT